MFPDRVKAISFRSKESSPQVLTDRCNLLSEMFASIRDRANDQLTNFIQEEFLSIRD